jgi:hypothetical protein
MSLTYTDRYAMPDIAIIAVLARLNVKACSLSEFEDLVLLEKQTDDSWPSDFVAHPLATLMRWGLIDAHQGFIRLTAEELTHLSFDARVWDIKFSMSPTAAEIEQAIGWRIWGVETPQPLT